MGSFIKKVFQPWNILGEDGDFRVSTHCFARAFDLIGFALTFLNCLLHFTACRSDVLRRFPGTYEEMVMAVFCRFTTVCTLLLLAVDIVVLQW